MSLRRAGVAGIQRHNEQLQQYRNVGEEFTNQQKEQTMAQLQVFKSNLEEFAAKYRNKINSNPEFRMQFHRMITSVGVDPLISQKGFWSDILGVGDFYFEIAVQIVQICLVTRERTGGLMDLDEMHRMLMKKRGPHAQAISLDDVEKAIGKLKELGNGYDLIVSADGLTKFVQSVPLELNVDHTYLLAFAKGNNRRFHYGDLAALKWTAERFSVCVSYLLQEGMLWIDKQDPCGQIVYYLS